MPISTDNVYGVVSTIFWSVMIIVTLTYVTLVMRADNNGEGGIMALITLLRRWTGKRGRRTAMMLAALGLFGASLFFGDSMITPAISVLSAVEGLKVIEPDFEDFIVPITAVIIVGLFSVQRRGTAAVGRFFGPVMIAWFVGDRRVRSARHRRQSRDPEGAVARPTPLTFLAGHFHIAFFSLAAIVLSVTGAEALYADMGHFGRKAITYGWLGLVLPACTLSYFGQGALVLADESKVSAPFFLLTPEWARIPMVLLATAATVIASQAVITGAFSVASQAARLGYLPRLRIEHTSASTIGQIYVPWINGVLMVMVLILVFAFRSSAALAYAFGMAVTGTITITTTLFFYYARTRWGWPLWVVLIGGGFLLLVDLMFFAANLTKLVHGAWLPLLIGDRRVHGDDDLAEGPRNRHAGKGKGRGSAARVRRRPARLQAAAGAHVRARRCSSTAARRRHPWRCAPTSSTTVCCIEHVIVMSIDTVPVPRLSDDERITIDELGYKRDGIIHVSACYGYMERPNIPAALRLLDPAHTEGHIDVDAASYFLSKLELMAGDEPTMAPWRKRLFIATSYITADAAAYFSLPLDRTVIIGSRIEV